jgi:trk system potassium uptake protein TrkA
MNIIIVGDGKVGAALATQLSYEGHNITIIDSNPQVLSDSSERLDIMAVIGNGAAMSTLQEAGAAEADLLIAATSRDELNLLTCLTAKKLGTDHTIARIRNPEYAQQLVVMREELGLSMTVNPEFAAAEEAYQLLQFPSFLKRESFAKGRVEIVSLPVGEGSKLIGIPLFKLYEIAGVNVLVCAVEREDGVHIPSGAFTLQEGDAIYVTADIKHLAKLVKNLGLVEKRIRSLLIIGGSRIAFYLARRCLDSGMSVKIIEQKHQRCVELAEAVPEAVIIEADGSRQDVLMAEGLKSYDAVITLTGMDEENLVLSMYAKHVGVPKVITKINRIEYADVFRKVGIGSIISPKGLCCANIVRYVRAMSSASGIDSVLALHTMVDGKVEALEFRVTRETRHKGEALKDIPLRKEMLIACITHEGNTILPRGDSSFVTGDTVIVVTAGEQVINDLDDIFAD